MQKIDLVKLFLRRNALVIDDFPDMRASMRNMLNVLGCKRVDTVCNGEEVIEYCSRNQYDLVLCDYNLGNGKNGQQILEELRFRGLLKNTAIFLMVTAETSREMVYGALEYLPDDYLTKPFTQPVLERRLCRLLAEKDFLGTIYQALDKKDYQMAITLCEQEISKGSRFRQKCLRIQAWCYYELQQYDSAKAIYELILGERDLEWARIGLGKCLLRKSDFSTAEAILKILIDKGVANAEVYDLMAEIQQKIGDHARAQQFLQEAVRISPNIIHRQKTLAKVSTQNGDWECAKKSHKHVMHIANNSCHESPENYLEYARCISTQLKNSEVKDKKLLKEADEVLIEARKQFPSEKSLRLQIEFISANLQFDAGNTEEFEKRRITLQEKIDIISDASPELTMDMAKSCQSMGMENKATELLTDLASRFSDNEKVSDMIDKIAKEPITRLGKKKAAALNQSAKDLFDKNNFKQAIKLINEALIIFPKNTALNMNLLAALIKQMQIESAEQGSLQICDEVVSRIGHLDETHPQFGRFNALCAEVKKLRYPPLA